MLLLATALDWESKRLGSFKERKRLHPYGTEFTLEGMAKKIIKLEVKTTEYFFSSNPVTD
jgi:hypothetical protein